MKLTAIVGTVDMNGYCGRSPHPEPSMRGAILPVISVRVENLGVTLDAPEPEYVITVQVPTSLLTEMAGDERVITGPDGKTYLAVELLPHEVNRLVPAWEDAPEVVLTEEQR